MKEKRGKHSKKPDFIQDLIKDWFPFTSRIELFARDKKEGWDVWGNEVESDIIIENYDNKLQESSSTSQRALSEIP